MNSTRLITIAVAIVAIGVALLGWFLGISPLLAQAERARSEQAAVDAMNAQHSAVLAQLQADFERIDELEAEYDEVQRAMPNGPATDLMLDEVDAAAAATGVVVTSVSFSEGVLVTAGSGESGVTNDPTAVPEALATRLASVPFAIAASGQYSSLVAFVDQLQLGDRLTLVTTLSFVGMAEASTAQIGGLLIVLADEPVTGAAAPPAPTETPTPTETPAP
jgi:Tfp pilus assembly protein PilO